MKMKNLHIDTDDSKLKQEFGSQNHFTVPERYFDDLPVIIRNRISKSGFLPGLTWQFSYTKLKAAMYVASFVIFASLFLVILNPWTRSQAPLNKLSVSTYQADSNYLMVNIDDYSEVMLLNIFLDSGIKDGQAAQQESKPLMFTDIDLLEDDAIYEYLKNDPIALELVCLN